MKIACLGWGSLIWRPEILNEGLASFWNQDGPGLPIEFARQSQDGRLTLVITPKANRVSVLWAELNCTSTEAARELLRRREGTVTRRIGVWPTEEASEYPHADEIGEWAGGHELHGVVWTALPPGLRENGEIPRDAPAPTQDEVIAYLANLSDEGRRIAREYIEKAPQQIETEYRQVIRRRLGWDRRGG